MNNYFVEITDTYAGEANYSWVTRHKVKAKSVRGALQKISRESGLHFKHDSLSRWNSSSGATCLFIDEWEDFHSKYLHVNYSLAV